MNEFEIIQESGTHFTVRLTVENHDLVVSVDKSSYAITIRTWEYMEVKSIVKVIAQICKNKELLKNPVINGFLSMLQQPENKEELDNFRAVYRELI